MVMARLVLPGVVVCVTNVATIQESMQLLIYTYICFPVSCEFWPSWSFISTHRRRRHFIHHLSITNFYHSWAPSCFYCAHGRSERAFQATKSLAHFRPWIGPQFRRCLDSRVSPGHPHRNFAKKHWSKLPGSTVQDGNDKSTLWRCGSWFIARYRMIHQDISSVVLMFCFSDLHWRLWAQNYAKLITFEDLWGKGRFKNHQDLKFHWPLALIPQKGLQMPRMRSTLVWKWSRKNWRQGGDFKNLRTTYLFIVWWIKWEGFHKELF